jgi:hypothetical protein
MNKKALRVLATVVVAMVTFLQACITNADGGVATYSESGVRQIYAFVNSNDGRLLVNYWDGSAWNWADQGTPPGTTVNGTPGSISYSEGGQQRIYAFVRGNDGQLYVNYWDGSAWNWQNQGSPSGTNVASSPSVITYSEGGVQQIYAFVLGSDGALYVNYWNGSGWQWANQGTPAPRRNLNSQPSVVTFTQGGTQRIYAFAISDGGGLYVNYWDGSAWNWTDQGTPPGTTLAGTPSATAYLVSGSPRIYTFVGSVDGRVHVNYWDGSTWQWADQGNPFGGAIFTPAGGAISYSTGGERIYAFTLYPVDPTEVLVNYWDGSAWQWQNLGAPPTTGVARSDNRWSPLSVITYNEGSTDMIYAFLRWGNGRLYVLRWDGAEWAWFDQGTL